MVSPETVAGWPSGSQVPESAGITTLHSSPVVLPMETSPARSVSGECVDDGRLVRRHAVCWED
jgi:hypothetical protein